MTKPTKKKLRGRKPALTKAVMADFVKLLGSNKTVRLACQTMAISETAFYAWLEKGADEDKGIYREFLEATTQARARTKNNLIGGIARHGKKDWRALAWLLERLDHNQFAARALMAETTLQNTKAQTTTTPSNEGENLLTGGFSVNISLKEKKAVEEQEPEPKL